MGTNPAIASISLGAERKFQVRLKPKGEIHNIWLSHGSLLLMQPGFQQEWLHQLPKAKTSDVRINLTFRPFCG
jgi:alkylated DNA repair dioxygenase AlkB